MNKKKVLNEILILVIPIIIILILTPFLLDKISIHRGLNNQYIDKHYAFLLGFLPYIIYKFKTAKDHN